MVDFVRVATTKGDLLVGGATGALARLPVGADTHVLTLDSGEPTGVKWAAPPGGGGGVSDGDKGDITVSGSGTVWTVDAEAITLAKIQHIATDSFLGRTTAATGDVEVLSKADALAILNVEDGATADQTDAEIEAAYNNQVDVVSQGEAEAGTSTTVRRWNALRVAQAIAALASGGGVQNNYNATTDPTVNDDSSAGYAVGSSWVNKTAGEAFKCSDPTVGAAVWNKSTLTADELATVAVSGDSDDLTEGTSKLLMTSAERTKLTNIETAADVTDAGNVGSAIHGATSKTTPVDADTVGLIDSAASNVLKKVTWSNIKATLKTYFDGLYQATHARLTDIAGITYAQGDILYHNGTNLVKLAKGTANQVLKMNTGATAPEWKAESGGGGGWAEIGTDEPTVDVAAVTFTGLTGYKESRLRWAFAAVTSQVKVRIEVRASAGTWRLIATGQSNSGDNVHIGEVRLNNLDGAVASDFIWASGFNQENFSNATVIDRSSATLSFAAIAYGLSGYSSYSETIDEVRITLSSGNIEGSNADSRGAFICEAR